MANLFLHNSNNEKFRASAFYAGNLIISLSCAQKFAGNSGFVASLPQLINSKIATKTSEKIWQDNFPAYSEENACCTSSGNKLVIVVHGGGLLSCERMDSDGKLNKQDVNDLLSGKCFDGVEIPVFSYSYFKNVKNLPVRYSVVLDLKTVKKLPTGFQDADSLVDNPLFIARVGCLNAARNYVKKAKMFYSSDKLGNWHSYNANFEQVCRVLFLSRGNDCLYGDAGFCDYYGNFIAVSSRERNKIVRSLEQML